MTTMAEAAAVVNLGSLAWRIQTTEGFVLREWSADVLASMARLEAEIAAVAPQDRRQRATVYVSDPDGDLWPEGVWKRARSLEPPW